MSQFNAGSLYLAGFAQAGAPHAGLIVPFSEETGHFVHIKINAGTQTWTRESRTQKINGSMTLTTLLKLHDVSAGAISPEQLDAAAALVATPAGGDFGECLPWVLGVVQVLHNQGLLRVTSIKDLGTEFSTFAQGNRGYASRNKFPNTVASGFAS